MSIQPRWLRGSRWPRRQALGLAIAGLAATMAACTGDHSLGSTAMRSERARPRDRQMVEEGKLRARPGLPIDAGPVGMQPLGLASGRDGQLYVPAGYQSERPAPLALMLHG